MLRKFTFSSVLFGSLAVGLLFWAPPRACGAYEIDDGSTETWDTSHYWGSSNIVVGKTVSNNKLLVGTAQGTISVHCSNLTVGSDASSASNALEVTSYAYVKASGVVAVGTYSADNEMYIHTGADVVSSYGVIGRESTGMNNSVLVSGVGSSWDVSKDLYVGYQGSSNSLEVASGAEVEAGSLYIGRLADSDGNTVEVDASGLDIDDNIVVGYLGDGNSLVVSGGSEVYSDYIYVGMGRTNDSNWVTGNDNSILITGDGTLWTNYSSVYVGTNGAAGNSITVEDGAELVVLGSVMISNDNDFVLGESGMLTVHSSFNTGADGFTFGDGATLAVGGELTGLTSGGIENGRGVTVFSEYGEWDMSGLDVTVGASSSSNTLQVKDGAWVSVQDLSVGTGANADSNRVYVAGDSLLEVGGSLALGSAGSIDNVITVYSGAVIQVEGDFAMTGDNVFNVSSGGWFKVGGSLDVSEEGFNFEEDGGIQVGGTLTGMTNVLDGGRSLSLSGSGASWDVGLAALQISNSTLAVSNGAYLASGAANLGADSLLKVTGAGSQWESSSVVSVRDGGVLVLDDGGSLTASEYYQDGSSVFTFDTVTTQELTQADALITASGSAEFESGAAVEFTGVISDITVDVTNRQLLVTSSDLIIAGVTNGTGSVLSNLNASAGNSLLSLDLYTDSSDLYAQMVRLSLAESAGFSEGTQMYDVSTDIDDMATDGNKKAVKQLTKLSSMSSSKQNTQMSQLYDRGAPTFMHMEGLYEAMGQVQNRGIVPDAYWAVGPQGPHLYGKQTQFWMKGFGSWGSQDGEGSFSGYDQSVYGMVFGMDKAFGNLLLGLAGGYSLSGIDQNDGDTSDAAMGYGILYGSWGTSSWFADGNMAFGLGSVENETGTDFDASSKFDAGQFGYYLGGGKEMVFRDDTIFITPTVAIQGGRWSQDGYTESSSDSVQKRVDDYSRWSFKSDLGVKVVFCRENKASVFMPEVHANWLHEFNADEDSVGYSLVGAGGNYAYSMPASVSDLFELGTGVSLWSQSRRGTVYEFSIGYDARFGSGYMANILNARMNIEF